MTSTRTTRFRVHSNLIDRFGSSLYDTTSKALAELVANAHDAQATTVNVTYPEEWKPEAQIRVSDDGDGMTPDEVEHYYLWIGMNRKVDIPKKAGRSPVGEFGVGKFAGLGIANTMHIITRQSGKRTELTLRRDAFKEDLTDVDLELRISNVPAHEKGTEVVLEDLATEIVPVPEEELVRDLSIEFSQVEGFVIYVNTREIPYGFGGEVRDMIEIDEQIENYGRVTGEILIAKRPKDVKVPGLVVYAHNRRMDGPTLFGYSIRSSQAKYYAYLTGRIDADWLMSTEAEAREGRNSPAVTGRMGLLQWRPEVIALTKAMRTRLREANKRTWDILKQESVDLLEEDKEIMSALGHPGAPISPATKRFLLRVVEGLDEYKPVTRVRIAKEVKRHIETGEQTYFLRMLREADPKDLEAFSRLLKDFSLRQVTNIAWEVRQRYEAIVRFRRMVGFGEKTKEPILQEFFEDHPWLLQEGYDKYVPNKGLANRLAGKGPLRPDHLYVVELAGHIVVVELKRMGKPLTVSHATQALNYRYEAMEQFEDARVDAWLVGERLNHELARQRKGDSWPHVQILTYDQILDQVEKRYEYLLQHLPKEAEWIREIEIPEVEPEMPKEVGVEEE